MKKFFQNASVFFEAAVDLRSRLLVFVASLLLVPTFFLPLWEISLYSNQFPDGLVVDIYSHSLKGAVSPNRDDLREINALNHYIGMHPLRADDFTEFKWIPFVIGGIILLGLRVVVMGKMSRLVDLFVLFTYFGLFSLWSFYDKLYLYGHDLDPTAAVKVAPFTPPVFGHLTMANFEVYSYPDWGSYFMVAVPIVLLLAVWLSARSSKKETA